MRWRGVKVDKETLNGDGRAFQVDGEALNDDGETS